MTFDSDRRIHLRASVWLAGEALGVGWVVGAMLAADKLLLQSRIRQVCSSRAAVCAASACLATLLLSTQAHAFV